MLKVLSRKKLQNLVSLFPYKYHRSKARAIIELAMPVDLYKEP